MKRFLSAAMLVASVMTADAERVALFALMQDDSRIKFEVSDGFVWEMKGGELSFHSKQVGTSASYGVENVKELQYGGAYNSVDLTESDTASPIVAFSIEDRKFMIKGVTEATHCQIVGMDGIAIYDEVIHDDKSISLDEGMEGVYVVNLNNKSLLKIYVK